MLENIEISNYKCFKDFKLDSLSQVNIISGDNNVGKTVLLEAFYLLNSYSNNSERTQENTQKRELLHINIIKSLVFIEQNRQKLELLPEWSSEEFILDVDNFDISSTNIHLINEDNIISVNETIKKSNWNHGGIVLSKFRDNKYYYKIYKKNNLPVIDNYTFISSSINDYTFLMKLIDNILEQDNSSEFFSLLKDLFNIEDIRKIKEIIMIKIDNKFMPLYNYGDGLKQFITILATLLAHKNKTIFIDEIENGIYYERFKKLWQSIIEVTKIQNNQLFIVTHSRECIEALIGASEESKYKDISSIQLYKDDKDNITPIVMEYKDFAYGINRGADVR